MRAWLAFPLALSLAILVSGCLQGAPPAARPAPDATHGEVAREGREAKAATLDGPTGGPATETTAHYNGTLLLRSACGCLDSPHLGDPSGFCFGLPTNVTLLRGVFAFSPSQQAGLEFWGPHDSYKNSWGGNTTDLVTPSPITLAYDRPLAGTWFVYGGPGIEGGAMSWTLDLTMVTDGVPNPEAVRLFETTQPSC